MDQDNLDKIVANTQTKADQVSQRFTESLKTLRTGRANASILSGIKVDAYGTSVPLIQVASVVAVEAQLLQVTPFDPNNLASIAQAIRNESSLGLNPTDDGRVVRIPIPPLTEERRHELVKQIGQKHEEAMVSLRDIRHEAIDAINEAKKSKTTSEDDAKRLISRIEDIAAKSKLALEKISKDKATEIMTL